METQTFTFASSPFVPVAIGFFGLGTGYFIWGGQALFGFPKTSPEVNRSLGLWGFWMPGFMQFLTGIYLLTGLTWFNVFSKAAPLYMAGLAFTAYGIHWFAMAHRRYIDSSAQLDGWMAIAFLFLSILGVDVFRRAGDIPVMIIFVGLTLIYATEVPTRLLCWKSGDSPCRAVPICYWCLADVLHVRDDCKSGIGRQSLDLGDCSAVISIHNVVCTRGRCVSQGNSGEAMKQFIYAQAEEIANQSGRAVFVYRDDLTTNCIWGFPSRSSEITSIRFFP